MIIVIHYAFALSLGGNYAIIGHTAADGGSGAARGRAGDETATIGLRRILDKEQANRKLLEEKVGARVVCLWQALFCGT